MSLSPVVLTVQLVLVIVFGVITVGTGLFARSLWRISQLISQRSPQPLAEIAETTQRVEVEATIAAEQSELLTAPLTGNECVAYQHRVEKRGVIGWTTVGEGGDSTGFTITEDGNTAYVSASIETIQLPPPTDPIEIDSLPDESDIQFTDTETMPDESLQSGGYRLYEARLTPETDVYVVGQTVVVQQIGDQNEQTVIDTTEVAAGESNELPSPQKQSQTSPGGQVFRVADLDTTTDRGWAYILTAVTAVSCVTTIILVALLLNSIL